MKLKKYRRSLTILAGLVLAAVTVFSYALADSMRNDADRMPPSYPVNEYGLTYGSAAKATSIETEPDLVSVVGEKGVEGYVYAAELHDPMPRNPEEAVEMMKRGLETRTIVVYKEDGKTAIGEFIVGGGYGVNASEELPEELSPLK